MNGYSRPYKEIFADPAHDITGKVKFGLGLLTA